MCSNMTLAKTLFTGKTLETPRCYFGNGHPQRYPKVWFLGSLNFNLTSSECVARLIWKTPQFHLFHLSIS